MLDTFLSVRACQFPRLALSPSLLNPVVYGLVGVGTWALAAPLGLRC